eukprot:2663088-Rhodomonas_salina.5
MAGKPLVLTPTSNASDAGADGVSDDVRAGAEPSRPTGKTARPLPMRRGKRHPHTRLLEVG